MIERIPFLSMLFLISACSAGTNARGGEASDDTGDASGDTADDASSGGSDDATDGDDGGGIVIEDPPVTDEDCDNVLEVTYRDFDVGHPDFEEEFLGDVVRRGLVEPTLGSDSKPVFLSTTGCPWDEATPTGCSNWTVSEPEITSQETFDQWYRDVDGVNYRFDRELVLEDTGDGTYAYSSNAFFPIGPDEGWGKTPPDHIGQNFLFTTELHLAFTYVAGQKFTFFGDDDLWIFVNGRLAMDLGGLHSQALGTIDFDAQAGALGISAGNVYRMDIFHAERHSTGSNFQIETTIGCFTPVDIDVY